MPTPLLMPALSPTMTEGNLIKWHKKEGDVVKAGQVLAEIETDKAIMEVEAVDEGTLGKIVIAAPTDNVAVNAVIGWILEEGEDPAVLNTLAATAPVTTTIPANAPSTNTPDVALLTNTTGGQTPDSQTPDDRQTRIMASPLAKKIAKNADISLATITGSGPKGRIVKADVEAALTKPTPKTVDNTALLPTTTTISDNTVASYRDVPLSGMRKVISKRLSESKQTIPHFYITLDCHMDAVMKLREQLSSVLKLSVNDFIIKACGMALSKVSLANATFHGDTIRYYDTVDMAVAVAIDGGLVTPVLRHVDKKSLKILSREMKDLASKAREFKLKPEDYQGGGFALSNLGMYGVKQFDAIINPPQASILAVGACEKRVIAGKDDSISVGSMMTCTLSCDHRVIDGAVAAEFLNTIKNYLENPFKLLVD